MTLKEDPYTTQARQLASELAALAIKQNIHPTKAFGGTSIERTQKVPHTKPLGIQQAQLYLREALGASAELDDIFERWNALHEEYAEHGQPRTTRPR